MSAIYGSLTTLFVFLYTVYLHACALLLGAEVAAAWARWPVRATGPSEGGGLMGRVRRIVDVIRHRRDTTEETVLRRACAAPRSSSRGDARRAGDASVGGWQSTE